jgi:hypothetical protein
MGIVDQDGKTTPRATKWRDDHEYQKVCEEIVKESYPQELIDAVPDPNKEKKAAERWFANKTGAGTISVGKMVACYIVLRNGDVSKAPEQVAKKPIAKKQSTAKKEQSSPDTNIGASTENDKKPASETNKSEKRTPPEICINLQIHISSDSSTDQIDQIFASMAKHIYPNLNT